MPGELSVQDGKWELRISLTDSKKRWQISALSALLLFLVLLPFLLYAQAGYLDSGALAWPLVAAFVVTTVLALSCWLAFGRQLVVTSAGLGWAVWGRGARGFVSWEFVEGVWIDFSDEDQKVPSRVRIQILLPASPSERSMLARRLPRKHRGYWTVIPGNAEGVADLLTEVEKHVDSLRIVRPGWLPGVETD